MKLNKIKQRDKKKFKLRTMIMLVVIIAVAGSLLITGIFTSKDVVANQTNYIKEQILSTAKVIANSELVKSELSAQEKPQKSKIKSYATQIERDTKADFIVVLDRNYIRYSHPDQEQIGKKFSDISDAAKSSNGRMHYSSNVGILGPGYRIFLPIYDDSGSQIGIVCVGLTEKSINSKIIAAQRPIIIGSSLGIIVGIIAASFLALRIRKLLLGMEPGEIAEKVTELSAINSSMSDGLIAIDNEQQVLIVNELAKKLFPTLTVGAKISADIYENIFPKSETSKNRVVLFGANKLIVTTRKLISGESKLGQVALIRDRSEYEELANQLAGTQQYVQALRAQEHEFLNKLQAISGLIELEQYQNAQDFIVTVKDNHQAELGYITKRIQFPAVAGFLLGKLNQAAEQGKTLDISRDSFLPKKLDDEQLTNDLIKLLGNLIDNAFEATNDNEKRTGLVELTIYYDEEGQTVIVKVIDNGSGISPDVKKHVLDEFYSTKGTKRGYGLALVNEIIKRRAGFIDFIAKEPTGTEVYVELPVTVVAERDKNEI